MWRQSWSEPSLTTASRGRAAVLWGIAAFVAGQLALILILERWRPDLRDPEYGCRLDRLEAQIAANPGRPLLVALGSSRVGAGFRPEVLSPYQTQDGESPLVFNMSLIASGPVMDLLCLRRLLDRGIHPRYALIEVLSPDLYWDGKKLELDICLPPYRLRWSDLPCLRAYSPRPWNPYRNWAEEQAAPWFSSRFCLLSHYLPKWVPADVRIRETFWENSIDSFGWVNTRLVSVTSEQYRKGVDVAQQEYAAPFGEWFHVAPTVDLAMRELLDTCRRENISVALLLMPEGSDFRSWYSPSARANIDSYLDGLCAEYAIPLVDATRWLPDDCFSDSHHLLPLGANRFTERLGREVLPVFLAGRLRPGRHAQFAHDR
jgi:hypothetical protein